MPAAIPVTVAVVLVPLTVAAVVVAEVQGLLLAAVPDPVKVVEPVPQIVNEPEMVGKEFTVTVTVLLVEVHVVVAFVPITWYPVPAAMPDHVKAVPVPVLAEPTMEPLLLYS